MKLKGIWFFECVYRFVGEWEFFGGRKVKR